MKDIKAVLPCMANGGFMAFHDAYYEGVDKALFTARKSYPNLFQDAGIATPVMGLDQNGIEWGGIRIFRYAA